MLFFVFSCRFLFCLLCYDYRQRQKRPSCGTSAFLHNGYRGSSSCGVKMTSCESNAKFIQDGKLYLHSSILLHWVVLNWEQNQTFLLSSLQLGTHRYAIGEENKRSQVRITKVFLKTKTSCCFPCCWQMCYYNWNKLCYVTQHKNLKWAWPCSSVNY